MGLAGCVAASLLGTRPARGAAVRDQTCARAPGVPVVTTSSGPRRVRHRAVPRETLRTIAARYGVRLTSLLRWNPEASDPPKKRDVLTVWTRQIPPPRQPVSYVVRPDDTWWRIGARHGVDSWAVRAMNWRRGGKLVPGETLTIWVDPIVFGHIQAEWDDPPFGVRPGAHGVGSPNDGKLVLGVQLPEHPAYIRKIPGSAYGTTHAVRTIVAALEDFRARSGYGGRLYVSALSRPRGGKLGGHRSHQTGRDVDIRLPLREELPQALAPRPSRRVDFRALMHLVQAFADTGEVVHIFLDYKLQRRLYRAGVEMGLDEQTLGDLMQWPRGSRASRGLVRDSHGHDDHIHVRVRCGPAEPECEALIPEGRWQPCGAPTPAK